MLLADIVRAFLVGILAVLVLEKHPALWLLCSVVALLGTFAGLFTPAAWSITPYVLAANSHFRWFWASGRFDKSL